ncbi:MAG TPA: hypothetical protein VFQ61_38080, partial [Polyangiaceae bacterium]|nr:hypothetical protein [Polyangiaceae bacterium]
AWGGRGRVISTIGFSAVRAWLEAASIVLSREPSPPRMVNATEGGARIAGFEEECLASLLESLPDCEIHSEELVRHARERARQPEGSEIAAWARAQADLVGRARRIARRIARLSRVAEQAAKQGKTSMSRKLTRLEQSERELAQSVAEAPLLDAWSFAAVDHLMDRHEATTEGSHAQAARGFAFEARLGETIEDSARQLQHELLQLSDRLTHSPLPHRREQP